MVERVATCRCGRARAVCTGDPVWVSVCHCLDCQRRSGSAFAAQARFRVELVMLSGDLSAWTAVGDSGARATFRFCPTCGTTIAYVADAVPDLIAIPVGTFADPGFPPPLVSNFEVRRHPWVAVLGDGIERR